MAKRIDHDHPLFLGSSDVPGAVQIGIQLTGMENYTLWSRAMQLNLLTKNKLGFIDGSIQRDGFTTEIEKKQWDRCNAMVLSWIMSNVSKDLVSGILFRSNAAQVWLDLQERFDKVNMSRIFHLHKAIVTHTQDKKVFGGTTPHTVANNEWWKETDKKFQAWPRTAGPPVVMNPISRQNYIVKS